MSKTKRYEIETRLSFTTNATSPADALGQLHETIIRINVENLNKNKQILVSFETIKKHTIVKEILEDYDSDK